MKKIISFALACLMMVSLCACHTNVPQTTTTTTAPTTEVTTVPDTPTENPEFKIDKEVVSEVKEQVNEGEAIETIGIQESTPKEEATIEEENLEPDASVQQENISYDGTYTGKGKSLLGKYQGLTYYSQMDSRWGSIMYSSIGDRSQTIKTSGCGPTSAAMIVSSSKGAITPPTMADISLRFGYRTASNGTAWAYWPFIADYFDFNYYAQTYNYSTMIAKLKTDKNKDGISDYFVVVSCGYGLFTSGGHYITLMGFNGKIIVYDPYYYAGKFNTASRRAAGVVTSGNIAYVTESAFKQYGNAQSYWIYSNDSAGTKKVTPVKPAAGATTFYVKTNGSTLNVRSGPGTGYGIVGSLKNGTKVTISAIAGNWSQIGTNKWVSNDYLAASAPSSSTKKDTTPTKTTTTTYYVKTNGSNLNVRSGPSTGYSIVGSLKKNTKVTVYETRNGWSRIGTNKWVSTTYLAKSTTTTTNTTVTYKTKINGLYRLKGYTTLYSKGNLTGTTYQYYAQTQIKVIKHYNASVDYIYVVKTGRYAYCKVSAFI